MTCLLKRIPRQIFASSLLSLLVIVFSIVALIVPAQAQPQQNTLSSPGQDATYVMGVDTTGTIRINSLSNLEALLNIIANLSEIAGLVGGLALISRSLYWGDLTIPILNWKLGKRTQIVIGCGLIAVGLSLAFVINWLVTPVRDDCCGGRS